MKVVILAGDLGTRISEKTDIKSLNRIAEYGQLMSFIIKIFGSRWIY